MSCEVQPASKPKPKAMYWIGWVLTVLPSLGLIMSAAMKFMQPTDAVEGFAKLGWDIKLAVGLGIVELACTVIYLIPKTSVLGAVLLTGYLGGAIATHVRIGEGFAAPLIMGIMVWLGIYLRCGRLRAILPLR